MYKFKNHLFTVAWQLYRINSASLKNLDKYSKRHRFKHKQFACQYELELIHFMISRFRFQSTSSQSSRWHSWVRSWIDGIQKVIGTVIIVIVIVIIVSVIVIIVSVIVIMMVVVGIWLVSEDGAVIGAGGWAHPWGGERRRWGIQVDDDPVVDVDDVDVDEVIISVISDCSWGQQRRRR